MAGTARSDVVKKKFQNLVRRMRPYGKSILVRNFQDGFDEKEVHSKLSALGEIKGLTFCCQQHDRNSFLIVFFKEPVNVEHAQGLATRERLLIKKHIFEYQTVPLCGIHQIKNAAHFIQSLDSCYLIDEQLSMAMVASETSFQEKMSIVGLIKLLRTRLKENPALSDKYLDGSRLWTYEQYGSRVNNFAQKGADVDLSLETKTLLATTDEKISLAHEIEKILKEDSQSWAKICVVPSRICPLLTFVHKNTGLRVDLSFNNIKAVLNSRVFRMFSREKRTKELVLAVKMWAQVNSFSGHGPHCEQTFSSYALACLVLYTVMQRNILPKIRELPTKVQGSLTVMVEGWHFLRVENSSKLPLAGDRSTSCAVLLEDFFSTMAGFNWLDEAVDMLDASSIKKTDLRLKPECSRLKMSKLIIIDPFERGRNLTGNLPDATVDRFVAVCQESLERLRVPAVQGCPWGLSALLGRPLRLPVCMKPRPPKRLYDEL